MGEQTIYEALRAGGLTPAGACGMMGNMWAESGLRSNNVQDNCPLTDSDYTYNVNAEIMSKWQFMSDRYGYGLCQWTLAERKCCLYEMAKSMGVSIADEKMQCDFCIFELQNDFPDLYKYLCSTDDLPGAAKRVCAEFERPAVNNFADRINAAQRYYNQLAGSGQGSCGEDACQIEPAPASKGETCEIKVRILQKGDKGRDVFVLQCGMADMGFSCGVPDGDFGKLTESGVKELQKSCAMNPTGIADQNVWQIIFQ